jgi:hypothetical protein
MKGPNAKNLLTSLLLLGLGFCSCVQPKQLDRRISLWRKDNIPYGTKIAYESLPFLFPDADISTNRATPTASLYSAENGKAYIIIVSTMDPQPAEAAALVSLAARGNQVFISANRMNDTLLHTLGVRAGYISPGADFLFGLPDSLRLGIYDPFAGGYHEFIYPGDSYDNWVASLDSQYTSILGRDSRGRPDFIRIGYKSGGAIFLHFAPLAFSNFFLLHKRNFAYWEQALSYFPSGMKKIVWDDYFRYPHWKPFSAFQYIMSSNSLSWAFWLLLALFALIYLFESKRRQRMVPVIPGLRNTSVDFVRTIGRLYYQRKDNRNLAGKMTAHFQDYVRTRWRLEDTGLDEAFVARLAYRTGYSKEDLEQMADIMRRIPSRAYVSDEDLMDLHRRLEAFYKYT